MVHRDIKTQNVLFIDKITNETKMVSAKLADYGEVYDLDSKEYNFIKTHIDEVDEFDCLTEYQGTIEYAPPEILQGDLRLLSKKSDIYSFGILIWEVFTERRPFENHGMDLMDLSQLIIEENLTPLKEKLENGEIKEIEYLKETPIEIKELVNKCLSKNVEERPEISELIEILLKIQEKYSLNYSTG